MSYSLSCKLLREKPAHYAIFDATTAIEKALSASPKAK
jgi:hypothetical protein